MRYRRSDTPGATYFFTVVTFRRHPIFAAPENPALLKSALRAVMARHPFTIDAIVVLPDHLHCLWTLPENDADFAAHCDYIHYNPVKHGLVAWPHSSFARFVERGIYPADWGAAPPEFSAGIGGE